MRSPRNKRRSTPDADTIVVTASPLDHYYSADGASVEGPVSLESILPFVKRGSIPPGTDQGGILIEWNDGIVGGTARGLRGTDWQYISIGLQSLDRFWLPLGDENGTIRFRVASVVPDTLNLRPVAFGGNGLCVDGKAQR